MMLALHPEENGWTCFNAADQVQYWSADKKQLDHEMTRDLRPATALEQVMFQQFGADARNGCRAIYPPMLASDYRSTQELSNV